MDVQELQAQLKQLENRIQSLEVQVNQQREVVKHFQGFKQEKKYSKPSIFKEWIKNNFWMVVGLFFVLLAVGWLISYVHSFNLIKPKHVLMMGNGTFLMCYLFGLSRVHQSWPIAQIALLLGASGLALLFIFDHLLFHQLSPSFNLTGLLVNIVITTVIGIYYQSEGLATTALGFAILIPFIPQLLIGHYFFFLSYIAVISFNAAMLLIFRNWHWPLYLAWVGTVSYLLLFLPSFALQTTFFEHVLTIFFPLTFFFIFSYLALRAFFQTNFHDPEAIFMLIATNGLYMTWIILDQPLKKWPFFILGSVVNCLMFKLIKNHTLIFPKSFIVKSVLTSLFFVFIALATFCLSPVIRDICLFLEALIFIWLSLYLRQEAHITSFISLYFILPLVNLSFFVSKPLVSQFLFEWSGVLIIGMGSIVVAIHLLNCAYPVCFRFVIACLTTACIGLLILLIWFISFHLFTFPYQARGFALILTTSIGVVLLVRGKKTLVAYIQQLGAWILGIVVFQLLFVESAYMSIPIRILTFFMIGLLLLTTVDRPLGSLNGYKKK